MTGALVSTLMLSYEHLIVADEIAGQLLSAHAPVRTDAESLAVDVIAACSQQGGGFAYNEHTIKHMKRDVYYSDFTGRVAASYEHWYEKAHAKVKDILARREDEIADPAMLERLSAVEARLAEDDRSWRSGQTDWWRFYVQDFTTCE
jgi:trimethylamine:corrinoid methyltransferase-like protein